MKPDFEKYHDRQFSDEFDPVDEDKADRLAEIADDLNDVKAMNKCQFMTTFKVKDIDKAVQELKDKGLVK